MNVIKPNFKMYNYTPPPKKKSNMKETQVSSPLHQHNIQFIK